MGSPDFALPSLEKLYQSEKINIKGVVTQPDRKKGRGQNYRSTPVKNKALELGLEVYESKNVNKNQFIKKLDNLNIDAIIVVAFGQILSSEILNLPDYGCINVHASLLPKYRGASPIHYAIINGEEKTGVTIMYMEEDLDTGDIISQKEVKIDKKDTVGDLHDRLACTGADLLVKTLINLEKGVIESKEQNHEEATYAHKLDKDFGEIDWEKSSEKIYNLVRGLNPWPGAFTFINGKLLKIWWTEVIDKSKIENKPGTILRADEKEGLIVQTGKGIIEIDKLQLEGRKKMSAKAFLRGYELKDGEMLG